MAEMILYTGPMFSSKTTRLLMQADKRQYQKQKIVSFKSRADDRYSVFGEIVTHNFNNFYEIKANDIDGKEIDFNIYKNKVVIVCNVASE